jgi:hypothetical protein
MQKDRDVRAEIAALFTDKNIVKLYYRAIEAGFSDADLATLKEVRSCSVEFFFLFKFLI